MITNQRITSDAKTRSLEKQGYRLVGKHSAVKVCLWCKKAIKGIDTCYKHAFYGIQSWRCVQMTPCLPFCTLRCAWCWRDIEHTVPRWSGQADEPGSIIDGCIQEHTKYLMGFLGDESIPKTRFQEAMKPRHFAISLSGEPTLYPRLPQLVSELSQRKISSFLVTNGTNPGMLKKLRENPPTQLYLTIPAPDEEVFKESCRPLVNEAWKKITSSAQIISEISCRKAVRITVAKGLNMVNPEGYASIIKDIEADFFEVKAYMHVGYSKYRLGIENMPLHSEIKSFAAQIASKARLRIIDEKPISRVVLLMKEDNTARKIGY